MFGATDWFQGVAAYGTAYGRVPPLGQQPLVQKGLRLAVTVHPQQPLARADLDTASAGCDNGDQAEREDLPSRDTKMKKRLVTSTIAAVVLLTGAAQAACDLSKEAYDRIKNGMSQAEVEAVMGCKAKFTTRVGDDLLQLQFWSETGAWKLIWVVLTDGSVTSKGLGLE